MDLTAIAVLGSVLLVLLASVIWVFAWRVNKRVTHIDNELRKITVMLSGIPNDSSLKEYMFSHDQRLLGIDEKISAFPDSEELQQYIRDQANQVIAFLSTPSEDRNNRITKKDVELSLQATNRLIERVLWALRFDEEKYTEQTASNVTTPIDQATKNIGKSTEHKDDHKETDDSVSIGALLESEGDDYNAMLKYMQLSGKGGVEAQHALKQAKIMRGS